jgi:hypothetical protein
MTCNKCGGTKSLDYYTWDTTGRDRAEEQLIRVHHRENPECDGSVENNDFDFS